MLSKDNFRQWIDNLRAAIQREHGSPRGVASYSELIGNVCWHFAPAEAPEWFQRSLDLRRSVSWEPNSISAGLLWKLGDREGLRAECAKAITIHEARAKELTARSAPKDKFKRQEQEAALRAALHQLALLNFLLEDFARAVEWTGIGIREDARWSEWDEGRGQAASSVYVFIRDASNAIVRRDSNGVRNALVALRAHLDTWPTDAGSMLSELYRYGLWLARSHFPQEVFDESPSARKGDVSV
jgi:hypothetical protein